MSKLSKELEQKLKDYMADLDGQRDNLCMEFMLETGLKPSEIRMVSTMCGNRLQWWFEKLDKSSIVLGEPV